MEFQTPWDPVPVLPPIPDLPEASPGAKRRGRRPAQGRAPTTDRSSDWRYHHLTLSGPGADITAFVAAARGAGTSPWTLDLDRIEEDVFNLAAAQPPAHRNLTIAGCHILARQFRDAVATRQAKVVARVGRSFACPFDLFVLLPVPTAILQLGPTHPKALSWLSDHWGVTDSLRQVAVRDRPSTGRRRPAGHSVIGYSFFAAGETPDIAITQLAATWPALRFELQTRSLD